MSQCGRCRKRGICRYKKKCEEETGFEVQVCKYYEGPPGGI